MTTLRTDSTHSGITIDYADGSGPLTICDEKPPQQSALKKRIFDLPDEGLQFLDDFADATDDVLKKFVEKPNIIDSWLKSRTWIIQPERDIFVKYYDVYVNPKYFDQVTGFAIYPGKIGFTKLSDVKMFTRGEAQTIEFDRYGSETGGYLGRPKDDWTKRSLPPFTENGEYHVYRTTEKFPTDIEIIDDEIDAWFGQVGGGHQFLILREEYTGKSIEEISNAVDGGREKIEKYFYTIGEIKRKDWIYEIK